jgi:hypothetical protein
MAETVTTWDHWGVTAGGTIFSLNPIDQARLLALGFHQLIERLVRADIPVLFLSFPRFVTDPDYLYRKLAPLLPADTDIARAREVHAATFQVAKVRVERELGGRAEAARCSAGREYPDLQVLEGAALRREMIRLRRELRAAKAQSTALVAERETLRSKIEAAKAMALEERCATLEARCTALMNELAALLQETLAVRSSRSWRMTHPLRVIASVIRRGAAAGSL